MSTQVAEHIRSLIFSGNLQAGQRVPQDEIAGQLGVSRLPVREALITLEADGLARDANSNTMFRSKTTTLQTGHRDAAGLGNPPPTNGARFLRAAAQRTY
jgi:DNA-binding FadR family transcriptional regulator